jgi:hypothetical protein
MRQITSDSSTDLSTISFLRRRLAMLAILAPCSLVGLTSSIPQAEYAFRPTAGEAWQARNESHELRIQVSRDGIEIDPERASEADVDSWKLRLRTTSYGRLDDLRELELESVCTDANRAELDHGHLVEWLENRPEGIEQGWTIEARPDGLEPLWIGLRIEGDLRLHVEDAARAGAFLDAGGAVRLRYRDLRAFDAIGRDLPARLRSSPRGAGIEVDDAGAVYPLIVDPVLGGPDWSAVGGQVFANLGISVAAAGDVNGDGYDDVVVGAPNYENLKPQEGGTFVYLGSATVPGIDPAWSTYGNQADASFGYSAATAGDVNGDGYADVIVGAPFFNHGQVDEGKAFLYLGSPGGLATTPAWTAEGDQDYRWFGFSVGAAGDVNGDGYGDVIVGATRLDLAFVYLGSSSGLDITPASTLHEANAWFGYSVATAGDVNGDGYSDVIVGAPGHEFSPSAAFVYMGSAAGLSTTAAWAPTESQADEFFGDSVSGAGDVNGDGYDDVLVGAPAFDGPEMEEGRAALYLGSAGGLALTPSWTVEGEQVDAQLGDAVAGAGDVNADGYGDVIIGAWHASNGQTQEGIASLYLGAASGLPASAHWTGESNQPYARYGHAVATGGDVNADGTSDVIVGAYLYTLAQGNEGGAFLYLAHGDCGALGVEYCTANPNSTGDPASISAWCSASSSAGSLRLQAQRVPNQFGIFFHGANQSQLPFGDGFLCATGDIVRGSVIKAILQVASYRYDNSDAKHSVASFVGSTRHFQYWFRDPMGGGAAFNTSNAISIGILP